jgi:hypothetical protein
LVAQPGGQREERDESGNKSFYLSGIGKLLFEVFDLPQEMGVAVLNGARCLVVSHIAVHHENAGERVLPKDGPGDCGRS